MTDKFKARDVNDVQEAVRWALAEDKALEVVGRGSMRALGRPAQWDATLDLSALSGVTLYEPEELVLSAKAGTLLREIEMLVDSRNQQLAFEPIDYGALLGVLPGKGSIGGALAANLAGPRRIKAGAARDHFLGFSGISGRGELFKSGGRVVKNVTGYDLCKLMAGSWGTLTAMTDVTIKVLPRAETEMTLLIQGVTDARAMRAMAAAMGSVCDVSGAAHLPERVAARLLPGLQSGRNATVLRLEGVEPSVLHRMRTLADLMKEFGALATIDRERSMALWRAIRDVTPFAQNGPAGTFPVWRISTAPANGAEVARLIAEQIDAEFLYDWAGGLVWAVLAPTEDAGELIVRATVSSCGGHAMLVRAPAAIRAMVPVFGPEEGALAALTARVKESFDPKGVFNAGRMWAGV